MVDLPGKKLLQLELQNSLIYLGRLYVHSFTKILFWREIFYLCYYILILYILGIWGFES